MTLSPTENIARYTDLQRARYNRIHWGDNAICLTSGSPARAPFDPAVKRAQENTSRSDLSGHYFHSDPIYMLELYQPYLENLGFPKKLEGDNFCPGNGVTQLFSVATKTLLKPDDVLLVPVPSYGFFLALAHLNNKHVLPIRLRPEDGYKLTPEYLDQEITRINNEFAAKGQNLKVTSFFNINPHNPTGVVYNKHDVEGLAEVIKKHDLRLVIDDMVYSGTEHEREFPDSERKHIAAPMASVPGMFDRTVTFFGLSKAYSLVHMRAGLAVGPKNLIRPMQKQIGKDVEFVSAPSQVALTEVFDNKNEQERNSYLQQQACEFAFKHQLLRTMINGWKEAKHAREYFARRGWNSPAEVAAATYPYPSALHTKYTEWTDAENKRYTNVFKPWLKKMLSAEEWEKFAKAEVKVEDEKLSRENNKIVCHYFEKYYQQFEQETRDNIDAQRQRLTQALTTGTPGLYASSIAKSGFFAIVDATKLKGKYVGSKKLEDAVNISEALMQEGNVAVLPGESMGYYGDRLLLRLSFASDIETLIKGIDGIKKFLGKVRGYNPARLSDNSIDVMDAMGNKNPEQYWTDRERALMSVADGHVAQR